MVRIGGGVSTQLNLNSTSLQSAGQSEHIKTVGSQIQENLFGKPKPDVLDAAGFPSLEEQLRLIHKYKKKMVIMIGDADEDYTVVLAASTIAMIDQQCVIYMGATFLASYADLPEVYLGVLAHEIGHQPKRWDKYKTKRELSQEEVYELCRHEEIRADIFAGKAMAEMGLSIEPLAQFLIQIEEGPHPEYLPAKDRADILRDAHAGRSYHRDNRRKLFPEFDRAKSPSGHLGDY